MTQENGNVVQFPTAEPVKKAIRLQSRHGVDMLRIEEDAFYVRGVKVEQGPEEARAVFNAFVAWLRQTGATTCH